MYKEKEYLVEKLKEAGIKSQVHSSLKKLKICQETHVGAVLRVDETFTRSNHKKSYDSTDGESKRRVRYYDRETKLKVVIADNNEEKVENILTEFLIVIGKGLLSDGEWREIELGEAKWFEEGDSILKSKVAVELEVTFKGSIYKDRIMQRKGINVMASKE